MASHGVARTSDPKPKTAEQRAAELDRIARYRALEDDLRARAANGDHGAETFAVTTRLLRLNPEYYTAWNARRRCITSGSSSRRSDGSWPSRASPSSSATAIATRSSEGSSISSSSATRPDPECQTAGKSGTTADAGGAANDDDDDDATKHAGRDDQGRELELEQERQRQRQEDLQVIESELHFTIPLLMEHPKCYWIWNYRLWVLELAISRLPLNAARAIWETELGLAGKMLTKDRRNFHAWDYRRNVVARLESADLGGGSLVEDEFEYTSRMIRVDLSNFSAWHNRSQLIARLLEERGADDKARRRFLDDELSLIREALNVGPEDQSLWYYHQFLMLNLVDYTGRQTMTPNLAIEDRVSYVMREIEDIKDLLEDYDDIKWVYEALMEYTLALARLEGREPATDEREDLKGWLGKMRMLDPMRNGRWNDVEREYGLH